MKKRLLTALLSFAILLSCFPATAIVMAEEDNYEGIGTENYENVVPQGGETLGSFDMLPPDVQALVTEAEETAHITMFEPDFYKPIYKVKSLYDFAGNLYYVVEYTNCGYMIFHAETMRVLEYTAESLSPYSNFYEGLYYCGPMGYYYDDNGVYRHTIAEESFCAEEDIEYAVEICQMLNENCVAAAKQENDAPPKEVRGSTAYMVPNANIISNLKTEDQIGYYTYKNYSGEIEGCCGYIAAGMLLLWYDKGKGVDQTINDFAYIKNKAFCGENFTHYLRTLGWCSDTMASGNSLIEAALSITMQPMDEVLKKYASKRFLNIEMKTMFLPFGRDDIINWIKKYNAPVILFGKLPGKSQIRGIPGLINHAVLVYGYTNSGALVVHYGWEGYSSIALSEITIQNGSALCVTSLSPYAPPMNDVKSGDWAYNAVAYCLKYGIIEGKAYNFWRYDKINRCEFVNAMYQLAGAPEVLKTDKDDLNRKFNDVDSMTTYHDALAWAYKNGILTGTDNNHISPYKYLTREQAATFLYRFSSKISCTFSTGGPNANSFPDYNKVSDYARATMNWATTRRLINGSSESDGKLYLLPQSYLQRDQAAQIIYNYILRGNH